MKILAVDLPHRFWSVALGGNLRNTDGAKSIVLNEIDGLSRGYDRVAIAGEGAGKRGELFRARLWPAYKAGRAERADHLWSLLADTTKHAEYAGWHVFSAPNSPDGYYEADDVIASIVAWATLHGHAVDILSGDSDLAQLVRDDMEIRMLRAYKGVHALDEAGVDEWLGVPPSAVAALKALGGDGGDGYGDTFPGLGHGTAIKMLRASGLNAVAAVHSAMTAEKPTAVQRTVKELGLDRLALALRLATVCRDVPLDFDVLETQRTPTTPPDVFGGFIGEVESDDASTPDEPRPGPVTSTALARQDTSMRLLVPAEEAFCRMVEFRAFVKRCMVRGQMGDYGPIPGCNRDVLFKAGAEKLSEIYGLAPEFEPLTTVERWDEPTLFFYRVRCRLVTKLDRTLVAEAVGSCNSRETKYAGRWVKRDQVPPHLDIERLKKRTFIAREGRDKGQEIVQWRIPNEDIFDQVNTIDKMAQKRAFVGAVIIATRSGGIFTQDMDDIPEAAYGQRRDAQQWDQ